MNNTSWILLDTETTGFASPIFVVELAAQRMRGWEPEGEPFRRLINQNQEIPAAASRVHGYTREILERDGDNAHVVYRDFAEYVDQRPLVAFNNAYDLDNVLWPEWNRLGIENFGIRGFCALRLAQRLLDPVPAGNCKLQTLRQYYRLPERGAHTALGDVQTVADLMAKVLRPIAEHRGLLTWESLVSFVTEEWYPSQIAFGKHKGKLIQDALKDPDLRNWLAWLATSTNPRNVRMAQWYLRQIESISEQISMPLFATAGMDDGAGQQKGEATSQSSLVIYINPELEELKQLVAQARARLAELQASYTKEKSQVDAVQAQLFREMKTHYQKRERLRLLVDYRRKYLESLTSGREEEAKQAETQYEQAKSQSDKDYEQAAEAVANKKRMTKEEDSRVKQLWKKLVNLYHPDRYASQPDKQETYDKLTRVINQARDVGDIETLQAIADDPEGYIRNQGWTKVEFSDAEEISELRRLYDLLQLEIISALESLEQLRQSSDYKLWQRTEVEPGVLDDLIDKMQKRIITEIDQLEKEASQLAAEIEELTSESPGFNI